MWQPFNIVGGSYTSWSRYADAQVSMNLFPESIESSPASVSGGTTVPGKMALYGTPGLTVFVTLPTAPVRCLAWVDESRCFAVGGSKLYEIFSDGTCSSALGDVGSDGLPVQIVGDGLEILILSAGLLYRYTDGNGLSTVSFQNGFGTVKTAGTAVTWISGATFDASNAGQPIVINGVSYTVASVTDPTDLVLTATAGTQDTAYTGTCGTQGTLVTWASGSTFDAALIAAVSAWAETGNVVTMTINGQAFTISSVTDATDLVLTDSAGDQAGVAFSISLGVAYSASYPVTGSSLAFLDGYFIVSRPGTRQINISAINDGTSWNPIDNAQKTSFPDYIVSILADHEQLYLFQGGDDGGVGRHRDGEFSAAAHPRGNEPSRLHCGGVAMPTGRRGGMADGRHARAAGGDDGRGVPAPARFDARCGGGVANLLHGGRCGLVRRIPSGPPVLGDRFPYRQCRVGV